MTAWPFLVYLIPLATWIWALWPDKKLKRAQRLSDEGDRLIAEGLHLLQYPNQEQWEAHMQAVSKWRGEVWAMQQELAEEVQL